MRSVLIDWDREFLLCGRCSGNGCAECGGRGERCGEWVPIHIQCACGWACDGDRFALMVPGGNCPDCGTDLESALADGSPDSHLEERDYEPWGDA